MARTSCWPTRPPPEVATIRQQLIGSRDADEQNCAALS